MTRKLLRKIIPQLLLIFFILKRKKKKYILLPNEQKEGWYYLAVKKLSILLYKITSKNNGDFYCLNCLHSFRTENKLKSHENLCRDKYFCLIIMPCEEDNILKFNQYMNSGKMPYIIYADIESLSKEIDGCAYNSKNSSTTKICEYIPCECSKLTIWEFNNIEKKAYFIS